MVKNNFEAKTKRILEMLKHKKKITEKVLELSI